jgi:hypothetical protein
VFSRLSLSGTAESLYSLQASQGVPQAPLFLGPGGNFYGLTAANNGTDLGIFKITPAGSFSWVIQGIANATTYIPA